MRKPLPHKLKLSLIIVAGLIAMWALGSAIIPGLTDPEQSLARAAKRVAAGPKSYEDSKRLSREFDKSIKRYLAKLADKPCPDIVKALRKVLPAVAFEVHAMDLPRGLKVVEVDTVLQAADYLLMKGSSGYHVFYLPGIEVFDDARLLNESAGPMLVALAHSGGQPPHFPQIRIWALLPDSISDETEKILPRVSGEGVAHFSHNNRDVVVDLSLTSLGQLESLFSVSTQQDDATAHQYLEWKDAHYVSRYEYGQSPFVTLYAVARCLRYPELAASHRQLLGQRGEELIRENKSPDAGGFTVRRLSAKPDSVTYLMRGNVGSFLIQVSRKNNAWTIASFKNVPSTTTLTNNVLASDTQAKKLAAEPLPTGNANPMVIEKTFNKGQKIIEGATSASSAVNVGTDSAKPSAGQKAQIVSSLSGPANIRIAPRLDAKPVSAVTKGAAVSIIGKQNGWYKVRYQGSEGFIYAGLVDYKKPEAYTTATITKTKPVLDSHKQSLAKMQIGERLVILGGIENNKYKVQLANGKTGYVDKDALKVSIDEPQFVP